MVLGRLYISNHWTELLNISLFHTRDSQMSKMVPGIFIRFHMHQSIICTGEIENLPGQVGGGGLRGTPLLIYV